MSRPSARVPLSAVLLCLCACAGEPLVFPDWEITPAAGTRVVGYAPVTAAERTTEIAVERDLVITEAFGRPLYQPADVEVGADGTIYVLDQGNSRIVAFAADGTPLHEFGNEGQGPGEFGYPRDVALAGGMVVINDQANSKLSLYRPDGSHQRDHRIEQRLNTFQGRGVDDELVLYRYHPAETQPPDRGPPVSDWIVSRHALDGTELSRAISHRARDEAYFVKDSWEGSVPIAAPFPVGAIGSDGAGYFSTGRQYQVHAFDPDGERSWALRVAVEPEVPSEADKREAARILHDNWEEMMPGFNVTYDDIRWPQTYPAIEGLLVDGRGYLYAFPFDGFGVGRDADGDAPVPVDVYSSAAERVVAGYLSLDYWQAALDDHVYRVETDPATEEQVVARYRLEAPFH